MTEPSNPSPEALERAERAAEAWRNEPPGVTLGLVPYIARGMQALIEERDGAFNQLNRAQLLEGEQRARAERAEAKLRAEHCGNSECTHSQCRAVLAEMALPKEPGRG